MKIHHLATLFVTTLFARFQVLLSDEATVAAFKPLEPVFPESGSVLLSVEASHLIAW
jgi:hypothetical protein